MSVFECEVRSFVDGRKFDELLERFNREGEPLGEDFPRLSELMMTLGHTVEVKWFRERRRFRWHGVKATLDITRGYGRIVELEELVGPDGREVALRKLYGLLNELKVQPTSREEFDRRYTYYREHWQELVSELEMEQAVI